MIESSRVPDLRLRPLRLEDEPAVRAAQSAMAPDDFEFAFGLAENTDWSGYVAECARLQRGTDTVTAYFPPSGAAGSPPRY